MLYHLDPLLNQLPVVVRPRACCFPPSPCQLGLTL
jgi:hypothetical protein